MRKRKTFIGMFIIIAILILGVGYAAINGVELFVNGTANVKANADFTVEYDTEHTVALSTTEKVEWTSGDVAVVSGEYTDSTSATMTVYLDSTHRNASAVYKIVNKSQELKATVDANVSSEISGNNTPEEYLSVSENLYSDEDCTTPIAADTKLAPGEVAYLKVEVSLTKLPVEDISNANFTITVDASPADSNDL